MKRARNKHPQKSTYTKCPNPLKHLTHYEVGNKKRVAVKKKRNHIKYTYKEIFVCLDK